MFKQIEDNLRFGRFKEGNINKIEKASKILSEGDFLLDKKDSFVYSYLKKKIPKAVSPAKQEEERKEPVPDCLPKNLRERRLSPEEIKKLCDEQKKALKAKEEAEKQKKKAECEKKKALKDKEKAQKQQEEAEKQKKKAEEDKLKALKDKEKALKEKEKEEKERKKAECEKKKLLKDKQKEAERLEEEKNKLDKQLRQKEIEAKLKEKLLKAQKNEIDKLKEKLKPPPKPVAKPSIKSKKQEFALIKPNQPPPIFYLSDGTFSLGSELKAYSHSIGSFPFPHYGNVGLPLIYNKIPDFATLSYK